MALLMFRRLQRRVFGWAFPQERELTEEERRLVLRVTAIVAVPLAFICLTALLAGGTVAWRYSQNAINDNKQAIKEARAANAATRDLTLQLNADRTEREREQAWALYDQCVENENQDQVTADLLRKFRRLTLQGPPSEARNEVLEALQTWLDAREPPGEPDCQIPPFSRPGR